MALTPIDIHHKEFKTARFGGYNEEDVDSFLDIVADEFERLLQESTDIKQQMEHMKKRLAEFEEMQTSLQSALLAASKSAEAVKEQARQESEALMSKAQEESDSLMRSAQEQARQTILAAQNDRQKAERAITKLQEVKKRYLESIKQLADDHLKDVAEWESRNEGEGVAIEPTAAAPAFEVPATSPPKPAEPVMPVAPPPLVQEQTAPVAPPQPAPTSPAPPAAEKPPQAAAAMPPPPAEPPARPASLPPQAKSPDAPVAREMREAASARGVEQVAPPGSEPSTEAPSSSNLVDEVLAMGSEDEEIFGDLEDDEEGREKGRRGRRDKKDKHFFWE